MTGLLTASEPATDSKPLAVSGVSRLYRGHMVLESLDLVLEEGSSTWVGGRNGAGKTTLLRIAAGLLAPDEGTVAVRGLDPERDRRRYQRQIGFLSAGNTGVYARLSVRRHLDYWACLAFLPRDERDPAVERAIADFELGELATRRLDRLSMGQRQRVRLAMTFMHDPTVVLLDEPRTSLDEPGTALLARAVERLRARGGTALTCAPRAVDTGLDFDRELILEDRKLRPA